MEELAKLEAERGTPGYVQEGGNVKHSAEAAGSLDGGSAVDGLGATGKMR